jgi:3-oxoacyl-[acyl-carrier protein] reductase
MPGVSSAIGPDSLLLTGRSTIVTGGARGIGRATALAFARLGARVAVCDKLPEELAATAAALADLGAQPITSSMDVRDPEAVERFVGDVVEAWGRVDVLVNNAGGGFKAAFVETSPKGEGALIAENFTQVTSFVRACVPHMIARRYGRIVNIASIAGKEGNPNASAYSASKAALIGLTKSLGKELATYDIAVNAITPAVARTAILGQTTQAHIDYMISKIPRGRTVEVHELAALVAWAASEECSFTTASVLDASGGRATY